MLFGGIVKLKRKIISLIVLSLIIFGSIQVTGLNNIDNKNDMDKINIKVKQHNDIDIENKEKECGNCESNEYYFGLIGSPNLLFDSDKLIEISGDPPESWDWRNATYNGITGNWVTSVKNQGKCGSCAAFASVACFESLYKMSEGDPNIEADFSEQFLVSCGKEWVGEKSLPLRMRGCSGSTILAVLDFIKKYGVINETCFPYTSGIDGVEAPCSDKCENWKDHRLRAEKYRLVAGRVIKKNGISAGWDNTKVKLALVNYGPLAAPMFVFEDFLNYTGGVYELDRSERWNWLGGHMVLIVGYQDDPTYDTGGYWICKNSWGPEWGENGYFKVKYEDYFNWIYDSVTSFESLRDLFQWLFGWGIGFPYIGIGYMACGFFMDITDDESKTYESYNDATKHSFSVITDSFTIKNDILNNFYLLVRLITSKNQ